MTSNIDNYGYIVNYLHCMLKHFSGADCSCLFLVLFMHQYDAMQGKEVLMLKTWISDAQWDLFPIGKASQKEEIFVPTGIITRCDSSHHMNWNLQTV